MELFTPELQRSQQQLNLRNKRLDIQSFFASIEQDPLAKQAIAFALVVSNCRHVHNIAQNAPLGSVTAALEATIDGTINQSPASFAELIQHLDVIQEALACLQSLLNGRKIDATTGQESPFSKAEYAAARQAIIYSQGAIKLTGLLAKSNEKMQILQSRLHIISRYRQLQTDEIPANPQVVNKMAGLYFDTFGDLPFRIIIQGTPEALKSTSNVEQIRCLLLGAVRYAVLWDQMGGRKWKLLLQRGKLLKKAKILHGQIKDILPEQYRQQVTHIKP